MRRHHPPASENVFTRSGVRREITDTYASNNESTWQRWKRIAGVVAYELTPFSMPSGKEIQQTFNSLNKQASCISKNILGLLLLVGRWACYKPLKRVGFPLVWVGGLVASQALMDMGQLFVIVSLFALMMMNLGERQEGEMSAYSVFNKGCQALLGQLTMDQFEREIRHLDHEPRAALRGGANNPPPLRQPRPPLSRDTGPGGQEGAEDSAEPRETGSRRSGKKARRNYEDRRKKRQQVQEQEENEAFLDDVAANGDW